MMKKKNVLLPLLSLAILASCTKSNTDADAGAADTPKESAGNTVARRHCLTADIRTEKLKKDPSLQAKWDEQERLLEAAIAKNETDPTAKATETFTGGIVINFLYKDNSDNMTDQQILDAVWATRGDFLGTNADLNKTTTYNSVKSTFAPMYFAVQKIVRRKTTVTQFNTSNHSMMYSSKGGIDPTQPKKYINVWVCRYDGMGYTNFPDSPPSDGYDGIVINRSVFGLGKLTNPDFNKNRTLTHELGHFFNLEHIWGDANCGDDRVADTPKHHDANYGCPSAGIKSTCAGKPVMMTMNYMDYVDDPCMYMFTKGQVARMKATWMPGGSRASYRLN